MTHSLHREGTKDNLSNDFTIYCLPAIGYNDKGSGSKRLRFLEIALRNNAVNVGLPGLGSLIKNSPEVMVEKVKNRFKNSIEDGLGDGVSPCVCCDNRDSLINILKETIDADLGLSIMVQGVLEEVEACLKEVGLRPHTVHHSLGVWGKTEKLPDKELREITTMCGHGMTGPTLVKQCIEDVISGAATTKEGANVLAGQCICGIFNPTRADALLKKIVSS